MNAAVWLWEGHWVTGWAVLGQGLLAGLYSTLASHQWHSAPLSSWQEPRHVLSLNSGKYRVSTALRTLVNIWCMNECKRSILRIVRPSWWLYLDCWTDDVCIYERPCGDVFCFFNFIYLFLAVLGLRFCARAFSSCGERGPLLIAVHGPLTIAASLVAEHRLQMRRLSSCGSRAQLLRGMWEPLRPGLEPVSPALAGRFSTTAPPEKPCGDVFMKGYSWCL